MNTEAMNLEQEIYGPPRLRHYVAALGLSVLVGGLLLVDGALVKGKRLTKARMPSRRRSAQWRSRR